MVRWWILEAGNRINTGCMATRLRMKVRIELFFTVVKSFWSVHNSCRNFCSKVSCFSLSQRLVTEAIGMQRQPWSTSTFLTKMNRLTALEWSLTTLAVSFCFPVTVGLNLTAQRARANQNRAMGSPWRQRWRWRWSGVRSSRWTWRKRCSRTLRKWTSWRTWGTSPLRENVLWERGWWRQRSSTRLRKRPWWWKRCWREPNQRWQQWCSTTRLGRRESLGIWTTRIYSTERNWHFPWYCKPERELYFFQLLVLEQVAEASAGSTKESSTEHLIWATIWSTFHSPILISLVLLESVLITFAAYMGCY